MPLRVPQWLEVPPADVSKDKKEDFVRAMVEVNKAEQCAIRRHDRVEYDVGRDA